MVIFLLSKCSNFQAVRAKLESLSDGIDEIESQINYLGSEVPSTVPVTRPDELSKLTFKLLHLRDKIDRKKLTVEHVKFCEPFFSSESFPYT